MINKAWNVGDVVEVNDLQTEYWRVTYVNQEDGVYHCRAEHDDGVTYVLYSHELHDPADVAFDEVMHEIRTR